MWDSKDFPKNVERKAPNLNPPNWCCLLQESTYLLLECLLSSSAQAHNYLETGRRGYLLSLTYVRQLRHGEKTIFMNVEKEYLNYSDHGSNLFTEMIFLIHQFLYFIHSRKSFSLGKQDWILFCPTMPGRLRNLNKEPK